MANASLSACLAEIKANPGKFYVYILSRPDGTPFYVGCGRGARIKRHAAEAKTAARSRKLSVIRKLWRRGEVIDYQVESWWESWGEAADRECALIAHYGRRDIGTGVLSNCTAGGEGFAELGKDAREKMARAAKARWADPHYRASMCQMSKRLWADPDRVALMAGSVKRTRLIRGRDTQHAALIKSKWADDEYRRRQLEAIAPAAEQLAKNSAVAAAKRWGKTGSRRRHSEILKSLYADEDYRAKQRDATKRSVGSPSQRKRQSEASLQMWNDPDRRKRLLEARQARFADPEVKARKAAAGRALWASPEYRERVMRARAEARKLKAASDEF